MAVRAAEQEWEREHRGIARSLPPEFAPIRDAPLGVPLQRIIDSIEVSRTAASKIRSGKMVPRAALGDALLAERAASSSYITAVTARPLTKP